MLANEENLHFEKPAASIHRACAAAAAALRASFGDLGRVDGHPARGGLLEACCPVFGVSLARED